DRNLDQTTSSVSRNAWFENCGRLDLGPIAACRERHTSNKSDSRRNVGLTAALLSCGRRGRRCTLCRDERARVGHVLAWRPISIREPRASCPAWPPTVRTPRRLQESAVRPWAPSNQAARGAVAPTLRHCGPVVPTLLDHPAAMMAARSPLIRSQAVRSQPASRL